MSLTAEAAEAVEYLDNLIKDQEKVLIGGSVGAIPLTRIDEYRAGVMLVRSMKKLKTQIVAIFERRGAVEEGQGETLSPMPEEK